MKDSKHREAFEEFADRAEKEIGDSLKRLVLYGSVARNEETGDSDVDVFAVVERDEQLEKLRDMAYEIGVLRNGVVINVQGRTEETFTGFEDSSYLRNIRREGVEYA